MSNLTSFPILNSNISENKFEIILNICRLTKQYFNSTDNVYILLFFAFRCVFFFHAGVQKVIIMRILYRQNLIYILSISNGII